MGTGPYLSTPSDWMGDYALSCRRFPPRTSRPVLCLSGKRDVMLTVPYQTTQVVFYSVRTLERTASRPIGPTHEACWSGLASSSCLMARVRAILRSALTRSEERRVGSEGR